MVNLNLHALYSDLTVVHTLIVLCVYIYIYIYIYINNKVGFGFVSQ